MAVVMDLRWSGITPEQYLRTLELVRWEEEKPDGALFHVASFDDDGIRVTDVWESEDHWNRFLEQRLMPGIEEAGITGQPETEMREAYRVFAPGYE
jgi:hypothetical protein